MSIEDQLRAYGSILDQRLDGVDLIELTHNRTGGRLYRRSSLWGVCAAVVTIVVAVVLVSTRTEHHAKHVVTATTAPSPSTTTTGPTLPARLPDRFTVKTSITGAFSPRPLATSDGDVWLAEAVESGSGTQVERRDATTGALKATIAIPRQETTFAITADGAGHVYVAGGGDGAVPRTTVSRISTANNHLDYTTVLPTGATCSCLVAANSQGIWLSGNGSTTAIALDPATADVVQIVPLPAPSTAVAVVGSTIDIGLQYARVAVIDPATKRVVRVDKVERNSGSTEVLARRVVAISPYRGAGNTWNAWVTRGDGVNMILLPDGNTSYPSSLHIGPEATSTTTGERLYFVAGNELGVWESQRGAVGVAQYDASRGSFGAVVATPGDAAPGVGGFDDVVSVGDSVWVRFGDSPGGEVLLVRPSYPGTATGLVPGPYGFDVPREWTFTPLANFGGSGSFAKWTNPSAPAQTVAYEVGGGSFGLVYKPDQSADLPGALTAANCDVASSQELSTTSESYTCAGSNQDLERKGVIAVRPFPQGWIRVEVTVPRTDDQLAQSILATVR